MVHANPLNIITPLLILVFAGTYNSKYKSKLLQIYHNQVVAQPWPAPLLSTPRQVTRPPPLNFAARPSHETQPPHRAARARPLIVRSVVPVPHRSGSR